MFTKQHMVRDCLCIIKEHALLYDKSACRTTSDTLTRHVASGAIFHSQICSNQRAPGCVTVVTVTAALWDVHMAASSEGTLGNRKHWGWDIFKASRSCRRVRYTVGGRCVDMCVYHCFISAFLANSGCLNE